MTKKIKKKASAKRATVASTMVARIQGGDRGVEEGVGFG